MKYIIILSLFLFSCNNDTVTISKEEYKELKGDTIKSEYPREFKIGNSNKNISIFVIELGSDGHEYAHNIYSYYDSYVCMHYPDCKKCKKDTL